MNEQTEQQALEGILTATLKVKEVTQSNGHAPETLLSESARKILDQTKGDVLSVFKNALDRLADTRRVCDAAEQHIKDKRSDVERALFEYVRAVEIVAVSNNKLQEAIGNMAVVNEQV